MAWDFATEPEFEEQLEWMRGFVRDEIDPLETLELDEDAFRKATDPLKQEVKARGMWAAHLEPELGGGGFGQVKLGLMHEILGRTPTGRWCSATTRPTRATPSCWPRRQRGAEGAVAPPAARREAPQRVLDDRARHGRRRPDLVHDAGGA